MIVFYRRIENSGRTNLIRNQSDFPIEIKTVEFLLKDDWHEPVTMRAVSRLLYNLQIDSILLFVCLTIRLGARVFYERIVNEA